MACYGESFLFLFCCSVRCLCSYDINAKIKRTNNKCSRCVSITKCARTSTPAELEICLARNGPPKTIEVKKYNYTPSQHAINLIYLVNLNLCFNSNSLEWLDQRPHILAYSQ
jgi:hypothetical protein